MTRAPFSTGTPVATLIAPSPFWAIAHLALWRTGAVAVPLGRQSPPAEIARSLRAAGAVALVADAEHRDLATRAAALQPVDVVAPADPGWPLAGSLAAVREAFTIDETAREMLARGPAETISHDGLFPGVDPASTALLLFTSGTSGTPKGVPLTHANLRAQVASLVEAWGWTPSDRILCALPLHHVHGIVNVVLCALWSGATVRFAAGFDARAAWEHIARGEGTVFMGVPTMYHRLVEAWRAASVGEKARWSRGASSFRLMVSGSAPLPARLFDAWRDITGQTLLERYGMTEIGMALSNPLHGERSRGHVGRPLPGVEVRLVDGAGTPVVAGEPGEIEVRGPGVFRGYWCDDAATAAAFRDGWFRTGDVAVLDPEGYRILGRASADILKSGGFKVSALEVESALLDHPAVRECAVVGIEDPEWGEAVVAAVVAHAGAVLGAEEIRAWLRTRVAPYKVPRRVLLVDALPRNAMGKVVKPQVRRFFA